MKQLGELLGTEWYLISSNELALMFLAAIVLVLVFCIFIGLLARQQDKRQEYMDTLDDDEYRKYRDYLDN